MLVLVAVLLVSMVTTGCNIRENLTERAVEGIAGRVVDGDVDFDTDAGSVRVQTDEGTVEIGGGSGSLPDAFPDEFPMPDDISIEFATGASTDDGTVVSVFAYSDQSFEELVSWFESQLPSNGWSVDGQQQITSDDVSQQSFTVSGHNFNGAVSIHDTPDDDSGRTAIQVRLGSQQD
jgi:hypothetical protein